MIPTMRAIAARITGQAISVFARFMTAPRTIWQGIDPVPHQRVYFANHSSNGDFVLLWTALPAPLRCQTRPVAALDYWLTSPLRAFIGRDVFNAVLIDRRPDQRTEDPVTLMATALDAQASLILFPEGQRNSSDHPLLPFKSGLYHLALARPQVDLVPVWIANLNKVMPKGEVIPVPLICTLTFGAPLHLTPDEPKQAFLARAAQALLDLRPQLSEAT
jgi:1-acyl-sn-glycerol-3-phosphate acyltransferase